QPGLRMCQMGIDVGAGQAHAEIGGKHAPRILVSEDAVENEIAGGLSVVHKLPVPPHRPRIVGSRKEFAGDGVDVAEIPKRPPPRPPPSWMRPSPRSQYS